MDKPNGQIKLWSSTYRFSATISKTIGIHFLRLWNSLITTLRVLLLEYLCSLLNKGYHLNLTVHPKWDLASSHARDLVVNLDELHQELKSAFSKAQLQYQGPTNAKRSLAPNFTVGEQALIKAKFFHTTQPSHKLSDKFLGPFEILVKARTHSFTLQLPDTFWGVHPVFQSPPLPVDIEGKLEYKISEIVDSKIDKRQSCKLLYLVRWLGYENTNEELSWLPAMELKHAKELVSDFHSAYLQKPGPISKL